MRFRDVAAFFDRMPCLDAYSDTLAFYGQLGLYDDSKRDSAVAQRRVISTSATALVPARRVVKAHGYTFILGHANPDSFMGGVDRVGYVAHEAPDLATVKTLAEFVLGQPGDTAYAARSWVKDKSFSEQSSDLAPEYNVYFSRTEIVEETNLVLIDGSIFIVRSTNIGASGTLVALCDELQGASRESATVRSGTWNATTETVSGFTTPTFTLRVRWQALYAYAGAHSPAFEAGDIQLVFAKSAVTVVPGATVTLGDGAWQVLSVMSLGDVWVCRATQKG